LPREKLQLKSDNHIELCIIKGVKHVKLYDVFLVIYRRAIKSSLNPTEIAIMPNLCIIAHHLTIAAINGNFGETHSSTVDNRVIQGKHLKNIASFCIEEVNAVAERYFIVPLKVEKSTMIRKCPILPQIYNLFYVIIRFLSLLLRKNKIGNHVTTTVVNGVARSHLDQIIYGLYRKDIFGDPVHELRDL
jgi:hypothetical protein